jgi:hypothetical protein
VLALEAAVARMAADPAIRKESAPSPTNSPLSKWTASDAICRGSIYFVNPDPVQGRE